MFIFPFFSPSQKYNVCVWGCVCVLHGFIAQSNFFLFILNYSVAYWRFFFTVFVNLALFMFYWKICLSLNLCTQLSSFIIYSYLLSFLFSFKYLKSLHPKQTCGYLQYSLIPTAHLVPTVFFFNTSHG